MYSKFYVHLMAYIKLKLFKQTFEIAVHIYEYASK